MEGIIGCINNWHFKGAGEMTAQLRAQAALSEDPHLTPSTHMAAKYRPRGLTPLLVSTAPDTHTVHRLTCRRNTHVHKIKIKRKNLVA